MLASDFIVNSLTYIYNKYWRFTERGRTGKHQSTEISSNSSAGHFSRWDSVSP
ncbi:hypothetical protein HMPREF0201_01597 [Cedecea davisae DSM 4568]|uniref:Uncharacterized protein n=1 Tax=Cedecea davisae DSM 4568 TaxID=566551 RepID=S3J0C8_9ENTR|nr:hypothetical protein HMPREF0201_01597 [Cedecea davisae DSM 4568]